jgi:fructuronate reductase
VTPRLSGATVRPPLGARPGVGIVHLGLGAFHRAHQAAYTADALAAEPGDWGICGVAPRRPDTVAALGPQDGLYGLVERGADADRIAVMTPIVAVLHAPSEAARLAALLAAPSTHVVTLTVTEKGYPRTPDGGLPAGDPDLAAELAGGEPRSALGHLARGLMRRAAAGDTGPVTVLSCDNLPRNGAVLERLVREYADRAGGTIDARFPCTMVDRVVPATTRADRAAVAAALGLDDHGAVVAEPFRQWVIEDDFAGPRPAWERAGAELVPDARPYEDRKLRLLNGVHSLLAYAGLLAGAVTVADAWTNPAVRGAAERLAADDLAPTLPGLDTDAYRAALDARWSNPRMMHRLDQIATDGSQKLPARFAAPARARLADGEPPRWIALALAAWARHLETGDVHDPGAAPVREALARAGDARARAAAVLAPFGPELADALGDLVADHLARLDADGAAALDRD